MLNLAFAAAAILLGDRLLRGAGPALRAGALIAFVLLTPLPILVLAGMEHTLQIAAVLWLLDRVRAADEDAPRPGAVVLASLAGAAALATGARYESLFLVVPAVVVLALDGRWRAAVAAAIGGLVPVVLYGAVSMARGWPPLPNSLLLKRATFEAVGLAGLLDRMGGHALRTLGEAPHLLVLLAAVLVLSALLPSPPAVRRWDAIFVAATLLHLQLAAIGWLFRYEAYLVAIGIVLVARHLADAGEFAAGRPRRVRAALTLAGLVVAAPLLTRAGQAIREGPLAIKNIYEQQYQMGLFLREIPVGSTVMANDIGAISYLADVRLVDLVRPGHAGDRARPPCRARGPRPARAAGREEPARRRGRLPFLVRRRPACRLDRGRDLEGAGQGGGRGPHGHVLRAGPGAGRAPCRRALRLPAATALAP